MKFIKRWLEKRKEEQRERESIAQVLHQKNIDYENKSIAEFEKAMFALPCPFVDGECRSACVHFAPGYISRLPRLDGRVFIAGTLPRCLLWNK